MDYIMGKVVFYDKFFHVFLLKEKRIHLSLLEKENPSMRSQLCPHLDEIIRISTKAYFCKHAWIIQKSSEICGKLRQKVPLSPFVKYVKENNLKPCHIFTVDQWNDVLFISYLKTDRTIVQDVVLSLLMSFNECLCDKDVRHVEILTASCARYIDMESNNFGEDFPEWFFGIHRSIENRFLFGYMEINPKFGFITLSDDKYMLACQYTNLNHKELSELVGSYVVIKKYVIITENFNEKGAKNSEFIFFDLQDVQRIHPIKVMPTHFPTKDPPQIPYNLNFTFILRRKANACLHNECSDEDMTRFWLQIHVLDLYDTQCSFPAFLRVNQQFANRMLGLQENYCYKIFHTHPIEEITVDQSLVVKDHLIYDMVDRSAYIQELYGPIQSEEKILSVEEVKELVTQKYNKLMQFEGVIEKKLLAKNLDGEQIITSRPYGFGTNGTKTHQIVFSFIKNNKKVFLDLYLCNWEANLMPLGLIPAMRLRVRNVIQQSGKYLKACLFTSFELIAYEPEEIFSTANLCSETKFDWGESHFLGSGKKMPLGVVIWSQLERAQIIQIQSKNTSSDFIDIVNHMCTKDFRCPQCVEVTRNFKFYLKLNVTDRMGQSIVIASDTSVLKYIFNLTEREYYKMELAFKALKDFKYDYFVAKERKDSQNEMDEFKLQVIDYVDTLNQIGFAGIALKVCLIKNTGKKPVWKYVDSKER